MVYKSYCFFRIKIIKTLKKPIFYRKKHVFWKFPKIKFNISIGCGPFRLFQKNRPFFIKSRYKIGKNPKDGRYFTVFSVFIDFRYPLKVDKTLYFKDKKGCFFNFSVFFQRQPWWKSTIFYKKVQKTRVFGLFNFYHKKHEKLIKIGFWQYMRLFSRGNYR